MTRSTMQIGGKNTFTPSYSPQLDLPRVQSASLCNPCRSRRSFDDTKWFLIRHQQNTIRHLELCATPEVDWLGMASSLGQQKIKSLITVRDVTVIYREPELIFQALMTVGFSLCSNKFWKKSVRQYSTLQDGRPQPLQAHSFNRFGPHNSQG